MPLRRNWPLWPRYRSLRPARDNAARCSAPSEVSEAAWPWHRRTFRFPRSRTHYWTAIRLDCCSIPPEIVQPEPGDHAAVADELFGLCVTGLPVGRRRARLDTILLAQPRQHGIDGFDDALGGLRR